MKSCCVAIVVPDAEVLQKWASDNGRKDTPVEDLCRDSVSEWTTSSVCDGSRVPLY